MARSRNTGVIALLTLSALMQACAEPTGQGLSSQFSATTNSPQIWRAWWYELRHQGGEPLYRYDFNSTRGALERRAALTSDAIYIVRPNLPSRGPFDAKPSETRFDSQNWLLARADDAIRFQAKERSGEWFFVRRDTLPLPGSFKEWEGKWYANTPTWYRGD